MPLEPEALQTRLLRELSSMPESVSRVAVDALYTAFALRRNEYPSTGVYVVDEVIMACALDLPTVMARSCREPSYRNTLPSKQCQARS